jgi:hypothetical protein
MNPRLAHLLVRLYPRAWRERYGTEFAALLETEGGGVRTAANVTWSALSERIFPTPGNSLEPSRFQSWCIRAPWAMFGLGPVFLLAAAYSVACFILWSGWKIFLTGADTPFGGHATGPVYGFENLYFQVGRSIYFSAPILIGWAIGIIAARQKLTAVWPAVGWILIALIGGTAQIHASRSAVTRGLGHIRMDFALGASGHGLPDGLFHAFVILSLTMLPYLIWRLQKAVAVRLGAG